VGTNGDSNWTIEFLAAGASVTRTWSYKPGYAAARKAQALADALGAVVESNESNNGASYDYAVDAVGAQPDLRISALTVSPNPSTLGTQVTLSVTECNAGSAAMGAHRLSAWGNRATAPAVGTNGDSNWTIGFLAAGASVTKTWSYKPGYAGVRKAQALADALGAVVESNESNNTASYDYAVNAVGAQPDLRISALTVSPNPSTLGTQVTLSVTEHNGNSAAVGAHQLSVWGNRASTPAPPATGDCNWTIAFLAAGGSVTKTWGYKPGYAGVRKAQALADAQNAVAESDEGNNTASYAYSITAAGASGALAVTSASALPTRGGRWRLRTRCRRRRRWMCVS